MAITPVTSGVGTLFTPFALKLSATRKYWPGWMETFGKAVTCHVVPVAAPYCTDQPLTETGLPPRLNSSM